MMRRAVIAVVILLIGLSLIACRKPGSKDLFKEQPQKPAIAENISPQAKLTKSAASKSDASHDIANSKKPDTSVQSEDSGNTLTGGDAMEVNGQNISEEFYYEKLSYEVIDRITGKSYGDKCDIGYDKLRYVRVLHWGFDHETHKGELIVNKAIAKDIVEIFKELYEVKYPIERMVLVDEYDADDIASMAADNTSSFNYRNVDGTDTLSLHSYGLAIDINPLYNPYVRTVNNKMSVLPESGSDYADRTLDCAYYIDTKDACYQAFIKRGFTWGGAWTHSKDYQHFQKDI